MSSRLALGTAQFGLDYGISNRKGITPEDAAFAILREAYLSGVDTIDTSRAYGDCEKLLGRFFNTGMRMKVVSKLPVCRKSDVLANIDNSILAIGGGSIYGYLIHKFESYRKDESLFEVLKSYKQGNKIEKIGFSVYTPQQLQTILDDKIDFDIIQFPYSIFDRRFEGYLGILKKMGVEIHVRSVFLQGLIFLQNRDLPKEAAKAAPYLDELRRAADRCGISVKALCLSFALANPMCDRVIIGVNDLAQFKSNMSDLSAEAKAGEILKDLSGLSIKDENVLLPYRWS